ncbi:hypothetical protein HK103_001370 [Boothiomyces macroporosus]|uniref:Uncharacterized protein n=1 Tax=Boothiomyces macroporosus TaxID=261099 RepID=A0AAD5UAG2_9FUNG|nr:hypothetical protein HK103_001370 [Boothiomyces macroporosus]
MLISILLYRVKGQIEIGVNTPQCWPSQAPYNSFSQQYTLTVYYKSNKSSPGLPISITQDNQTQCFPSLTTPNTFAYIQTNPVSNVSLLYDKCSGFTCTEGCINTGLANTVPCSPYSFSNLTFANQSALKKRYFAPRDTTCNSTEAYSITVPIFDNCTAINSQFAKSVLTSTNLTQYLCSDAECRNCTTSTTVQPWEINTNCEPVIDLNGKVISRVISQVFLKNQEPNPSPGPTETQLPSSSSQGISIWYYVIPAIIIGVAILLTATYCGVKKYKPLKLALNRDRGVSSQTEEQSGVMLLQLESVLRGFPTEVDDID